MAAWNDDTEMEYGKDDGNERKNGHKRKFALVEIHEKMWPDADVPWADLHPKDVLVKSEAIGCWTIETWRDEVGMEYVLLSQSSEEKSNVDCNSSTNASLEGSA